MRIFSNDYFELILENEKVFIKTFKKGFPLKELDEIVRAINRLKLTNFVNLKNALEEETPVPVEIGLWLPPLEIDVSKDKMTAQLIVHESTILENEVLFYKELNDLLEKRKSFTGSSRLIYIQ